MSKKINAYFHVSEYSMHFSIDFYFLVIFIFNQILGDGGWGVTGNNESKDRGLGRSTARPEHS